MIFDTKTLQDRKNKTAKALDSVLGSDDVVLVHAGHPIQKPGGHDQTYSFLPHPDYFWLTGIRRPTGISAYSKNEGWVDFVQPVTRDEKIWEGGGESFPGKDIAEFRKWHADKKYSRTFDLGQISTSFSVDPSKDSVGILEAYNEVRRVKDASEIALVKKIAGIAAEGYKKLPAFIRPGVSERDIQIEYETAVLKAGSEKFPYDSIVGTGTNSAVLHAIPTSRVVKEGEMVLIDAGADIEDYCVDITRVYSSGTFSSQQKALYDIVLKAQTESIALCKPGTHWKDVHLTSARVIAEGLKDLGILNCSADEAIANHAIAVFFPHGVGHMVGLRVRDVGGKFNPNPHKYAGARLRVDLPLREGYLMTVEPGCYFINALLNDSETRTTFKNEINWAETDKWMNVGGVRLEDDIHVTSRGPENLTGIIPK
jgi:Xaa-Pro dipeptidase